MAKAKTSRFDLLINTNEKNKAQQQLQRHGLTLSEYLRSNIATIANYGLPDNFALNDDQEARYEANHWYRYPKFHSVKSAMRYLND